MIISAALRRARAPPQVTNGLLGTKADMDDAAEEWTTVAAAKERREARFNAPPGREQEKADLRADAGVAESAEMTAAIRATQTVAHFARTSMPEFVEETSMLDTFMRSLYEEHTLVSSSAFGAYDPVVPVAGAVSAFRVCIFHTMDACDGSRRAPGVFFV